MEGALGHSERDSHFGLHPSQVASLQLACQPQDQAEFADSDEGRGLRTHLLSWAAGQSRAGGSGENNTDSGQEWPVSDSGFPSLST